MKALINLAILGMVSVDEVILHGSGIKSSPYSVKIRITNLTEKDIMFSLPKGQIFENKKAKSGYQNLASSKNLKEILLSGETKTITEGSFCINKHQDAPIGGKGNITVFKIKGNFYDQDSLHKLILRNLGFELDKDYKLMRKGK